MGLVAGGEWDETLGSPVRQINIAIRARLKSWGLNHGKSSGGTTEAGVSLVLQLAQPDLQDEAALVGITSFFSMSRH